MRDKPWWQKRNLQIEYDDLSATDRAEKIAKLIANAGCKFCPYIKLKGDCAGSNEAACTKAITDWLLDKPKVARIITPPEKENE